MQIIICNYDAKQSKQGEDSNEVVHPALVEDTIEMREIFIRWQLPLISSESFLLIFYSCRWFVS